MSSYYRPLRYLCDVFSDMRTCCETQNYSYLKGLIEEAQVLANRMEAGLRGKNSIQEMESEIKKLEKRLKELKEQVDAADKTGKESS